MPQVQAFILIFSIPAAIVSAVYLYFNHKKKKESLEDKQNRERKESIIWYFIYNYFWAKYPVIVVLVVFLVVMTLIIKIVY